MKNYVSTYVGMLMLLLSVNSARAADSTFAATLSLHGAKKAPVLSPVATRRSEPAVNELPQMRVSTMGPETLVVNKAAQYVISLDNLGARFSQTVNVRCDLPSWVQLENYDCSVGRLIETSPRLVWRVDDISAQGHEELRMNLVPIEPKAFDLSVDISVQPANVQKRIVVQQPMLELSLEGPEKVRFRESSAWRLKVSNPGTGQLNDVIVDVFSGGNKLATQMVKSIVAGGSQPIDLNINPLQAGSHAIKVVARAGDLVSETKSSFVVRRGVLNARIRGPSQVFAGTTLPYEVLVENAGNDSVKNVLLTLDVPRGLKYSSGLKDSTTTASGVSWVVSEIAIGQKMRFLVQLDVTQGGRHPLQVVATTMDRMSSKDQFVTRALASPDLKLEVIDPIGPRSIDDLAEYTIKVTNHGTAAAGEVSVTAICDESMEPIDVSGSAAIREGRIYFEPSPRLEPGQELTYLVKLRAQNVGSHDFRVIVKSAWPEVRLGVQETTRFVAPSQFDENELPQDGEAAVRSVLKRTTSHLVR